MRLHSITPVLIAATLAVGLAVAKPAMSQSSNPALERQRAAAAQAQRDAARDSQAFQQEQRARDQRARTEATLRTMRSDELAGGPAPYSSYQPSSIAPMEPPRAATPMPLNADQARMDALMADALARSNARVKAASSTGNR